MNAIEISTFFQNFISHPFSLIGIITLVLIIIFCWKKLKTFSIDIIHYLKSFINFFIRIYNQRLDFMVEEWGNEGNCISEDKAYITFSVSNILCYSGELKGHQHSDNSSFYGMVHISENKLIRCVRVILKKEVKFEVFNIRHGNKVGYGNIFAKIYSIRNRFNEDLLRIKCDKYMMQHFGQKIFYLHKENINLYEKMEIVNSSGR